VPCGGVDGTGWRQLCPARQCLGTDTQRTAAGLRHMKTLFFESYLQLLGRIVKPRQFTSPLSHLKTSDGSKGLQSGLQHRRLLGVPATGPAQPCRDVTEPEPLRLLSAHGAEAFRADESPTGRPQHRAGVQREEWVKRDLRRRRGSILL